MSYNTHYDFSLRSGEIVGGTLSTSTARFLAMDKASELQKDIHVYRINRDAKEYMFTVEHERV